MIFISKAKQSKAKQSKARGAGAVDTKKMMRLITPTLLERSSKQLDKETDWDLLAEMDAEEEGQPVPMQDNPLTKTSTSEDSPDPHRQLDDGVMQEIFRRQAEAKAKGPLHSKAPQLQMRMGSPNTLFNKKT